MPNEIRPCTLWGETFDAMKVVSLNKESHELKARYYDARQAVKLV